MNRRDYIQSICREHYARKAARKQVFCWLPTRVYRSEFWRDGYRWLEYVWHDEADGKFYTEKYA